MILVKLNHIQNLSHGKKGHLNNTYYGKYSNEIQG
jgi:hypothetical protein